MAAWPSYSSESEGKVLDFHNFIEVGWELLLEAIGHEEVRRLAKERNESTTDHNATYKPTSLELSQRHYISSNLPCFCNAATATLSCFAMAIKLYKSPVRLMDAEH